MIDPDYMPQPGEVVASEAFVTDYRGERHLSYIRVTVRLCLSAEAARAVQRRYPRAQLVAILDGYGEAAEIEIPLRLNDEDGQPYLAWRDRLLAQVLEAAHGDTGGDTAPALSAQERAKP